VANKGQFQKGRKKTGGRKAGGSKTQVELKQAILDAFAALDGAAYLMKVGKENPAVFCSLLGRVLPMTLAGDPNNPIRYQEVELVFGQSQDALPAGVQGAAPDLETLEHRGSA
jgi:hypothetical protein